MESVRCTDFVALATDLMEGTLPEDVEAALRAHAEGCDGCAEYLRQLHDTVRILRGLGSAGH